MADEVVVDRELLKAIDADTRINILKSLYERRKTQSELAKELKVSAPTILDHVAKLEKVGLVRRIEEGRKWKYYELTQKGRRLISPDRKPITAIIMLAVGLLFLWYAFFIFPNSHEKHTSERSVPTLTEGYGEGFGAAKAFVEEPAPEKTHEDGLLQSLLTIIGLALVIAGLLNLKGGSKKL